MGVAPGFNADFKADTAAALPFLAELELFELDAVEGLRLLALEFLSSSGMVTGCGRSRDEFDATDGFPPGTLMTTSSLFERCTTCAVAPGCSRKDTTVLSPLRCAFTSAKPRPRSVSARGTSTAGILI